jgi:hypothetical protein
MYLGFNIILRELFKNNLTKEHFFASIVKLIIWLISKGLEDLKHRTLHIKNIALCMTPFSKEGTEGTA